ncbi:MAG: hypothetical protein ACLU06_05220 [Eggerthellaceae bacterium]
MILRDDMFGREINIGDTVCKIDDNTFWRIVGFSKDLLGRDRAEMEPVSQVGPFFAMVNDEGVVERVGKME